MRPGDLIAILPLIIVAGAAVVIMLVIALHRSHRLTAGLALAALAGAFAAIFRALAPEPALVTSLLIIDRFSLFYMGLVFAASAAVILLAYGYLAARDCRREEFYILVLLATLGSAVLVSAAHFASFFLGLEILSVSLYALVAYVPRAGSVEAGIKYLVLAAASAAILLFGMALVYAETGTMRFAAEPVIPSTPALVGLALIVVGVGFKLALVPFHMWTPDVYEGAPAPVTAFIATVSKGAMFAFLLRFADAFGNHARPEQVVIFSAIAVLSMLVGNLLALLQTNVKRLLAYSSIAHLGYLLVAFMAGRERGAEAATFYLVAYFVTMLGALGVVTVLSPATRDADRMEDYRGLARRRPVVAAVFTAMLLSLAGVPLTAGFIGKFFVLGAGVAEHLWMLVLVMAAASAVSIFYYLRLVIEMYREAEPSGGNMVTQQHVTMPPSVSLTGGIVLAAMALALIGLGVYPGPLAELVEVVAEALR
jgi:NADH-quinone oxidoreductase subunit N